MMKGTVVRKRDEGYGFIKPETGEKDVFFHASALVDFAFDDLKEGDLVTFEVEDGPKGPAATNITRVAGAAANDEDGGEEAPAMEL